MDWNELVLHPVRLRALQHLRAAGEDFAMLVCPDHPTPINTMTHCKDPVPYLIYGSGIKGNGASAYDESNAAKTGLFTDSGVSLMQRFLKG